MWVLSTFRLAMCDYAAMRVGFVRVICWQCVIMMLYVWVLRGFLLAMFDYAATHVGLKRFSVWNV